MLHQDSSRQRSRRPNSGLPTSRSHNFASPAAVTCQPSITRMFDNSQIPAAPNRISSSRRVAQSQPAHTHRWSSVGREERFHVTARDHWSQQMDLRPQNGHGNSGTGIRSGDYIAM